ncbi:hypothetical protein EJ05DRAFT_488875 [Pseudovirgaria hyperparasitica]|uniref:RRM domain-containing protein n=1 Tax=Pseudovirgaria hyperparasitica TaxID=470096 RepID=A0A6A6VY07_9PEZI|nr:uncharacterized protein EJ05DRAFT_488875 [Pseudovirgaria hyperparasitica]KAF2754719.1 hypothetical protein EJ05DRAFT_488875 [Pseudovirgaria hyperparasitica]
MWSALFAPPQTRRPVPAAAPEEPIVQPPIVQPPIVQTILVPSVAEKPAREEITAEPPKSPGKYIPPQRRHLDQPPVQYPSTDTMLFVAGFTRNSDDATNERHVRIIFRGFEIVEVGRRMRRGASTWRTPRFYCCVTFSTAAEAKLARRALNHRRRLGFVISVAPWRESDPGKHMNRQSEWPVLVQS